MKTFKRGDFIITKGQLTDLIYLLRDMTEEEIKEMGGLPYQWSTLHNRKLREEFGITDRSIIDIAHGVLYIASSNNYREFISGIRSALKLGLSVYSVVVEDVYKTGDVQTKKREIGDIVECSGSVDTLNLYQILALNMYGASCYVKDLEGAAHFRYITGINSIARNYDTNKMEPREFMKRYYVKNKIPKSKQLKVE